jgi:hypothetical protein
MKVIEMIFWETKESRVKLGIGVVSKECKVKSGVMRDAGNVLQSGTVGRR